MSECKHKYLKQEDRTDYECELCGHEIDRETYRYIEALEARIKELENPWVSVEDRLPEYKVTVLLFMKGCCKEDYMLTGYYEPDYQRFVSGANKFSNISYWQPLPSPPKDTTE